MLDVVFRYQQLIKDNLKEVAKLITTEQGKTLADAEGDVMRGLQVRSRIIAMPAGSRANKTIGTSRLWRTCVPTPP